MLSKSSKLELGFDHYILKFTISRFVISRFDCTYYQIINYLVSKGNSKDEIHHPNTIA